MHENKKKKTMPSSSKSRMNVNFTPEHHRDSLREGREGRRKESLESTPENEGEGVDRIE